MNREQAKVLLPIIQAFSEGKTIQLLGREGWTDLYNDFIFDISYHYRIKPEFKDGDILYATDWISGYIYINKESNPDIATCYCYKLTGGGYLHICNLENHYDCTLPSITIKEEETRFATESEKQQLFDALAKENKRWDAEKKAIVDLPKDTDLRPTLSKYHIKPKPKYRPFRTAQECLSEMLKHQPFGWLKPVNECVNNSITINISSIGCDDDYPIQFTNDYGDYCFEYLYKEFTFMDGTPFGILEEE
jgi:hypothetical protein